MSQELTHSPEPGSYHIHREGDFLNITLHVPGDWKGKAYLRTSLFRPQHKYREIIDKTERSVPRRFHEWGDFPMERREDGTFTISLPLVTVGFFEAKAFFLPEGQIEPVWPEGDNVFIKVEPASTVISNSIYSAFVRLFIGEKAIKDIRGELKTLETQRKKDYAIIPDSGKFRDLAAQVDFIVDELGFDIIMLLPVHPTPTTYARMGLFGSPYAALDFESVDPALAQFDKETTPMEQFGELIDAVHAKHARIFMDIPVNHTGWASQLQVHHPEYFVKSDAGKFVSPGAWGVTWSDLAKLDFSQKGLWEYMADVFLFWCDKGIDGFRCDAGYMIPLEAWKYITARVRRQYPGTVFLLEGLGGKVSTTEKLLTECDLNWAYSEMFQNYDQGQMEWYLQQYQGITFSKGPLVNFSETHDNQRLASVSKSFSRLRNGITALLSDTGTFGITCGVEWYADEKIDVHRLTSMNWGQADNQVAYLRRLNNIIKTHPSFRAGSSMKKIHTSQKNSIAYKRLSPDGRQTMIVVANLSERVNDVYVDRQEAGELLDYRQDLLTGEDILVEPHDKTFRVALRPHHIAAVCNDPSYHPQVMDLRTDGFIREIKAARLLKLQITKLFLSAGMAVDEELLEEKTKAFEADPYAFFFDHFEARPPVVQWSHPRDVRRQVIIPLHTPVLVQAKHYFRFRLRNRQGIMEHGEGFYLDHNRYVSIIPPGVFDRWEEDYSMDIEVYDGNRVWRHTSSLQVASRQMFAPALKYSRQQIHEDHTLVGLSVNKGGGASLARGAFSALQSKYDALLAANLDPVFPNDRHIMLTRMRGWTVYKGFSRAIIPEYQEQFSHQHNTTRYYFQMPAGGGLYIPLWLTFRFDETSDSLDVIIYRARKAGEPVPGDATPVKIILRPDVESRNHHELTKAFAGPEKNWPGQVSERETGFAFGHQGARLQMHMPGGTFVREDEWQYMVGRPVEKERGMDGDGDLYSPGYFTVYLHGGEEYKISAEVRAEELDSSGFDTGQTGLEPEAQANTSSGSTEDGDRDAGNASKSVKHTKESLQSEEPGIRDLLKDAIRQFMVRRNHNQTVLAGFPWFLDWGRDTLICLRGIIAAGYLKEAESILVEFAAFEERGTLPNVIRGNDTSNRDTSDAPLWFIAALKDLAETAGPSLLQKEAGGRTLLDVARSIARHYMEGTPNGIRMDPDSSLVYSPTHFTWMDTNYPAGTPRQGYPIEIQALWYHALAFLAEKDEEGSHWEELAQKVRRSIEKYFVIDNPDPMLPEHKYLSDCLHADGFVAAARAQPDDHVRPNQLFAITLGAINDASLSAGILAVSEELLVPGAIRSLADRRNQYPLPVYHQGELLNDPVKPYQGHYTGDEDHQRKPAYHNGTAWTWPFPSYCEALWMTWGKGAQKNAQDILATSIKQIQQGGVGHIPEVLDGNHPHTQKGCFAQAWGITEFYRVARLLDFLPLQ